jgi:hypothetical protein
MAVDVLSFAVSANVPAELVEIFPLPSQADAVLYAPVAFNVPPVPILICPAEGSEPALN